MFGVGVKVTSDMRPSVLLINPWIYDFAAFDLWAKPVGLLYLAARLRRAGVRTRLIDCLDRLHPEAGAPRRRAAWRPGSGQWAREAVITPKPLEGTPRRYSRYGLPETVFIKELTAGPRPALVLVTSSMTYWYLGPQRAIALVKQTWPGVPVVMGGTYATLCSDHARENSGADLVVTGPGEDQLARAAADLTGEAWDLNGRLDREGPGSWPDLSLYPRLDFAPLLTSRGCPGRCPYCASRRLFDGFFQRSADGVLAEIEDRYHRLGLTDFAFFDDALLMGAEGHLKPILEGVVRRGFKVRFHVPNGLHVGSITPDLSRLMYEAGFQTIRLGLESLDPHRQASLGSKVPAGGFDWALNNLKRAGFPPEQIGVYILFGLPGQPWNEALETARMVEAAGARPYLAEYSPLPGTHMWEEAVAASPFDLAGEPLYHNNTFFPCRDRDFSWDKVRWIKRAALA